MCAYACVCFCGCFSNSLCDCLHVHVRTCAQVEIKARTMLAEAAHKGHSKNDFVYQSGPRYAPIEHADSVTESERLLALYKARISRTTVCVLSLLK